MSERDWADELANTVFTVWTNTIVYEGKRDAVAAMLRNAHARGLREGAAAERQRAAKECDAVAAIYECSVGTKSEWMACAAKLCRDAILRDFGAGPACHPPADDRTVQQVEAERRTSGGCCDRHADQHACDCLERAKASEAAPSLCPALRPRTLTQAQADDLKAFRERSEAKAKRCPCGGEYRPLKKDHFPVPLSACIKCGADGPPWTDVVGETPGAGPEKPTVAERVITRLDDFAKRLEDVPDDIRCENCGAPLDLLDTSWRSAGENLWEHRCPGAHPQAGSFRGVPAAQPHGPPVAENTTAEELSARLAKLPVQPGQAWRHYKGAYYSVLTVCLREHDLEPTVVYRKFGGSPAFARPVKEWLEIVPGAGDCAPRPRYVPAGLPQVVDFKPEFLKDREFAGMESWPTGEPHGPPVTADPGAGCCGTCALWHDSGYCKVARHLVPNVLDHTVATGVLVLTHAEYPCDISAWRAKENPAGG